MRQRSNIKMLKDIHRICDVQQMGAAFEFERANARVHDLNGRQEAEISALQGSYEGWRQAVSGASFQLAASTAWAAEILSNQKAVEDTQVKIRDAETGLLRVRARRMVLSARRDAVADLTRLAERHEQRRREEAALDAQAGRATAGWWSE